MSILASLNPQQQQAVSLTQGPLIIVAGPGTGKTKTLTARIAHLLQIGNDAPGILALTFTRKAAAEIRTRLAAGASPGTMPHVTTFHALCQQLLGKKLQFVDEPTRQSIIKEVAKRAGWQLAAKEIGLQISQAKNLPTWKQPEPELAAVVDAYNQALHARGLLDFDDLLQQACHALQQQQIMPHFTHIMVDEFQDTNLLQYQLLQLLAPRAESICAIGDPLQSIYGFRGASGGIFDRFRHDYPHAQEVTLTTNYRSVPQVVGLANAIFPQAPQLTAHSHQVGKVQTIEVLNEYSEAQWIITYIEQQLGGTSFLQSHQVGHGDAQAQFRDFAVLYRTHQAARTTQKLLAESGIPFQVAGEGSPYEQPKVAMIIEVMRALVQSKQIAAPSGFSEPQWQVIREQLLLQNELPPSKLAAAIMAALGIEPTASLRQFAGTLVRFDQRGTEAFLAYIDDIADQEFYDPNANIVTLLTIHAAKGLEFAHVFLLAAEEDILPHKRVATQPEALAEERRLFYVAATRAKIQLDILHARTRGGNPAKTSRFVSELAEKVVPRVIDPELQSQARKREKRRQKRAQTSLF